MFNDRKDGAKYIQLYMYYKDLIINGILKKDEKMPSIRKCAQSFELSRTTVETAFELLAAEGYIISKPQSGYYVCSMDYADAAVSCLSAQNEEKNASGTIKYDLVSASADKSGFNFALWRRYVKSALRHDERLLSYGEPQGEYDLRHAICTYVNKERGVVCSPSQIVIAAGTQSLLAILCAITKDKKNVAFVGPDFERGKAVFEDYGKEVVCTIGQHEDISVLNEAKACIIYTSPSHIDSWGSVLEPQKRAEILRFAKANDCLIIEDDYDSEFRYYSRPVPSLQGMSAGNNVVYIGTFSKLLLPSIRISFMVLPVSLTDAYFKRGLLYNQTASKAEQIALCQYIRDGHLAARIRKQRKQYVQKTNIICKRAGELLPEAVELSKCSASYLIRVKVQTEISASRIADEALKNGLRLRAIGNSGGKAQLLISDTGIDIGMCDDMLELLKISIQPFLA